MKRKRYLAAGLTFGVALAIAFGGWGYAGHASATPGKSCNPEPGHGTPGCHKDATPTTQKKNPTTTTTKKSTPTTKKSTPTTKKSTVTTASKKTTTTTAKPKTNTTAGGTTATTVATTTTTAAVKPAGDGTFSDVSQSHPYYTQIGDMVARQVIAGNPDGTFQPDQPVTREAFARMIVKATGLAVTGDEKCPFTDVASGKEADPLFPDKYVAVLAAEGITLGETPSTFAPSDNLTRQQLITMVARAAKLSDPPASFAPAFVAGQFFPEEHFVNASKVASAGLLDGWQGMGSTSDFFAPATRGEVSLMLYNLIHR